MLKLRIKYEVGRIMGWRRGMVLYPFMLFRDASDTVTDPLFRHEMEHVYQVRRMGWWTFYLKYLWLLRKGYSAHPFEAEARERQNDPLTEEEQALKDAS